MSPSLLSKLAENTYHSKINLPAVVCMLSCFAFARVFQSSCSLTKNSHVSIRLDNSSSLLMIPKHGYLLRTLQTDTPH